MKKKARKDNKRCFIVTKEEIDLVVYLSYGYKYFDDNSIK